MFRKVLEKVVSYSVAGAVVVPGFAMMGLGGVVLAIIGKLKELRYDI